MRITLIHALKHSIVPIETSFAKLWPEARLMNLLDDSLSVDLARDGGLSEAMTERFLNLGRYATATGSDAILFTCSAFGPCIEAVARAHAPMPVLKPNEAMIEQAAAQRTPHRAALDLCADAGFDAARISRPRSNWCRNLSRARLQRSIAATARPTTGWWSKPPGICATAISSRLRSTAWRRPPAEVAAATGRPVLTTPDSAVAKLKAMLC